MARSLRQQDWERARDRCESCQMPEELDIEPFQLDHIRAQKHAGRTTLMNLCVACLPCNPYKSSDAAGYDPVTDTLQRLFNPRRDEWTEHFEWEGPVLTGKTPIGRTTIEVLRINRADRVEHRRLLIVAGEFPPADE